MKKTKIIYWIFTILFALFMLQSAIGNLMLTEEWVKIMKDLGYPPYLLQFLGVAKLLGVIAILVPRFPLLKEWAYAGFTFDIVGVMYSSIAAFGTRNDVIGGMVFMLVILVVMFVSLIYSRKLYGPYPKAVA
jgi:uncharacterized membrane protein YphA (DoxX/SURF4 family)